MNEELKLLVLRIFYFKVGNQSFPQNSPLLANEIFCMSPFLNADTVDKAFLKLQGEGLLEVNQKLNPPNTYLTEKGIEVATKLKKWTPDNG